MVVFMYLTVDELRDSGILKVLVFLQIVLCVLSCVNKR